MQITTEMIKQLRETTGAGIFDCRKALESSDGDLEKAIDFLREKGLAWPPSAPTGRPPKALWSSTPTAADGWA